MSESNIIEQLESNSLKAKLEGITTLKDQILEGNCSPHMQDKLMELSSDLIRSNNFKVIENTLSCLSLLIEYMADDFLEHHSHRLQALIRTSVCKTFQNRKESVRDEAKNLIINYISEVGASSPVIPDVMQQLKSNSEHALESVASFFGDLVEIEEYKTFGIDFHELFELLVKNLTHRSAKVRNVSIATLASYYNDGYREIFKICEQNKIRDTILDQLREQCPTSPKPASKKPKPSFNVASGKTSPKGKLHHDFSHTSIASVGANEVIDHMHDIKPKDMPLAKVGRFFDKCIDVLGDRKAQWSDRVDYLKDIVNIAAAYVDTEEEEAFIDLLEDLCKQCMREVLLELRSAVSREGCTCLSCLGILYKQKFEKCAKIVVPFLLKIVVVTKQVISYSADCCLKSLINNCYCLRSLPDFLRTNVRNNALKSKVSFYVFMICQNVRRFETVPHYFAKNIDAIFEATEHYLGDAGSEIRVNARRIVWSLSVFYPERVNELVSKLDHSQIKLIEELDHSDLEGIAFEIPENRPIPMIEDDIIYSEPKSNHQRSLITPNSKIGTRRSNIREEESTHHAHSHMSSNEASIESDDTLEPIVTVERAKRKSVEHPTIARKDRNESDSKSKPPMADVKSKGSDGNFLLTCRNVKNLSDWSNKVDALHELKELYEENPNYMKHNSKHDFKKIFVDPIMEAFCDSKIRVVEASVPLIVLSIEQYSNLWSHFISDILVQCFKLLSEKNQSIRENVYKLLHSLTEVYYPKVIISNLLSILETPQRRVKVACLEYMCHILNFEEYLDFFNTVNMAKELLKRVTQCLNDKHSDVKQASVYLVAFLYSKIPEILLKTIKALPPRVQTVIVNEMSHSIPSLENDLNESFKNEPTESKSRRISKSNINTNLMNEFISSDIESEEMSEEFSTEITIPSILSQLTDSSLSDQAKFDLMLELLKIIQTISNSKSNPDFDTYLGQMLVLLLDLDAKNQIMLPLFILYELVENHYKSVHNFADIIFSKVLTVVESKDPETVLIAKDLSKTLLLKRSFEENLNSLIPLLLDHTQESNSKESLDENTVLSLNLLFSCFEHIFNPSNSTDKGILDIHERSLEVIIETYIQHKNTDVRKIVVYLAAKLVVLLSNNQGYQVFIKNLPDISQKMIAYFVKEKFTQ
eukprot:TRINITY_DN3188_c2_g5_i1.p1 TRINITY_DN3188_c2_g5~~TRINITY_DN3188_c2_g5_i1.p1  ORF type:complete len:1154 (+),score=280.65 TRINITY_DN3188_c2_g5_i1:698-4159(+)